MLWLLNFSWKMYSLRWGMLLLIYLGGQKIFRIGLTFLGSWWEFLCLPRIMLERRSVGFSVMVWILILHYTWGCLVIGVLLYSLLCLSINNDTCLLCWGWQKQVHMFPFYESFSLLNYHLKPVPFKDITMDKERYSRWIYLYLRIGRYSLVHLSCV